MASFEKDAFTFVCFSWKQSASDPPILPAGGQNWLLLGKKVRLKIIIYYDLISSND